MKISSSTLGFLTLLAACCVNGQGTVIYDQQSSTDETSSPPGLLQIPTTPGYGDGESFTPTLSSVGFLRLMVAPIGSNQGGLIYCHLRSGSIYGRIIGTTASVQLADTFSGPLNLEFASPVTLTPGTTYYFEPVVDHSWSMGIGQYNYSGGSGFLAGTPEAWNLWFREGIIVPEPSSVALLVVVGGGVWVTRRRIRQ